MLTKSVVMPWVRVVLNILLMLVILVVVSFVVTLIIRLLLPIVPHVLILAVAYLVPVSFIALIWIRRRMIGEPPTDSMSIHAKVCIALIVAIIMSSMLWNAATPGWTEPDQNTMDNRANVQLGNAIRSTPITAYQEDTLQAELMSCLGEVCEAAETCTCGYLLGSGPLSCFKEDGSLDLIIEEALDACDQAYNDRKYEFKLEQYYANQTASDEVSTP